MGIGQSGRVGVHIISMVFGGGGNCQWEIAKNNDAQALWMVNVLSGILRTSGLFAAIGLSTQII